MNIETVIKKAFIDLKSKNIDTIIDDTDESISSKMKKFNLIGVPFQIIIGKKSEDDLVEFKEIGKDATKTKTEEIYKIIIKKLQN